MENTSQTFEQTERTTLTRSLKRGTYDKQTIYDILDESLVCHVSYVQNGQPFMIPISYGRMDDKLYIHGSVGSHFFRELAKGIDVCICITLLDGLILARSTFHHSVNYRSVVIFGKTELVTDEEERWKALECFTEHIIPGRWNDARQPNASEMKKTMVISIPLEEASAKVRTGGVNDDEEDMDLNVWAGVLPLKLVPQLPEPDAALDSSIVLPDYIKNYNNSVKIV
ncbi:pyridoxamine 5'-phosphate oxidase family protein [Xanthocytophaga agilis]|uniref:Pyridoxamine 5'-phosphate oxidase family protein n=1 Tax=Xanthocytophaga agilis TaxID=3048010 RepID=A0AAE3UDD3_9BACT|nr:pyridoxamine 5'-phosphate oxidase family protein [Xanthocytophaga agilis]MDJ1499052.1 pyridoxamine 5'-phosphate oxidase family protein [Xanthocytophaga agilis]